MKATCAALLAVLWVAVSGPVLAQSANAGGTDLQALKAAAASDKKGLVAATLSLTRAEARKFWPVYDSYQLRLTALDRRQTRVIEDLVGRDKPLTDALARHVVAELVAIDDDRARAMRAFHSRLQRALPATKVALALQLEGKLRAIRDYEIAAAMPLLH